MFETSSGTVAILNETKTSSLSETSIDLDMVNCPNRINSVLAPELVHLNDRPASSMDVEPNRFELMSRADDVYRKVLDLKTRQVFVESHVKVSDYRQLAEQLGPMATRQIDYLEQAATTLQSAAIEEVNPTANGGGVQMILMAQSHLLNELGILDRWRLMVPEEKAFRVTKDWHNTFQGVVNHQPEHIEAGLAVYNSWIENSNVPILGDYLRTADVVTLHDPQPHGLISIIPDNIPTVWRSHIQNRTDLINTPGSIQALLWDFVYKGKVEKASAQVYHPVNEFVPGNIKQEVTNFMPATFDPFDDLNRLNLSEAEKQAAKDFIDQILLSSHLLKPKDLSKDQDWQQSPIDWDRPMIALIARFDPSKGMAEALRAYVRSREMMLLSGLKQQEIPQLMILGNGSIDDPDGPSELEKMMALRSGLDKSFRSDIKIVRLPHNDKAINTLMTYAYIGLQPSLYEGFETRASDWLWHGKPVIVSNRGGLPLQVHNKKSGFIVNPEDTEQFARLITQLVVNKDQYKEMSDWAKLYGRTYNYQEFSTVANAIRWVNLYSRLLNGGPRGDSRWRIGELIDNQSNTKLANHYRKLGSLVIAA